jgi:hypothetical protein
MAREQENPMAVVPTDIPIGTIVSYGVAFDRDHISKQGWLPCDGSALSRSTYADLFAVIGTIHGDGDDKTTFNLPNYQGRFQRGADPTASVDRDAESRLPVARGGATGTRVGSLQLGATALPSIRFTTDESGKHKHGVPHLPTDSSWYQIAGGHYAAWNSGSVQSSKSGNHSHRILGGDKETRPINVAVNYIIYTGYKTP